MVASLRGRGWRDVKISPVDFLLHRQQSLFVGDHSAGSAIVDKAFAHAIQTAALRLCCFIAGSFQASTSLGGFDFAQPTDGTAPLAP